MNVLFICRSNAERSQIAEILFNYHSKKHKAFSAGADVENEKTFGALRLWNGYAEIITMQSDCRSSRSLPY